MKRSIPFRPTLLALVLATNFPVAHAAVPKDMLVIGKAADPQTLDPAVTIDNNDWTVTYPSYQRLVQYKTDGDKGSTDVEGDLYCFGDTIQSQQAGHQCEAGKAGERHHARQSG